MSWQTLPYLVPYMISLVISTGVGLYAWRRRELAGATAYAGVALSQASWTLGYILELTSSSLESKIFWDNIQWVASVGWFFAFLAFAFQYAGHKPIHSARIRGLLAIVPTIFVVLIFTDHLHGWVRPAAWLVPGEPFSALVYDFTPVTWIWAIYGYGLLFAGMAFLVTRYIRPHYLYRAQVGTVILGTLVPVVGTVLTLMGITFTFHRDTTPFTSALGNLVVAWGLFRYQLFNVVPVARDKVIESMGDAVVVLDAQNRLVDLNPAAQDLISQTASEAIGQPVAQVLSAWSDLVERYRDVGEASDEIIVDAGEGQRHFELRLSPLRNRRGRLTGRLIVVREITARKQAEQALQRAHDELESRVEERTEELARANTSLQAEIAEREQAEEALRRHTERLSILHEIDQGILAAQSPRAIAQAAASRIRQLIPCQRAGVVLINAEAGEAEIVAFDAGIESQVTEDTRIHLDQLGDIVEELAQGKMAMFEDLQARGQVMETLYAEGVRLSANVPLMFRGNLIGALTFWMTDHDTFAPEDEGTARQVANQLAIAIQQARLREQVQRDADQLEERVADRTRELWTMYEVMAIASRSVDLEATLAQSLERVLEAVRSDAGVIHILEPEERTLRLAVERGIPTNILPQITSLPAEDLGEWINEHGEAILVPEITSDLRIAGPTIEPRRYIGLPMRAGGQVLGLLGVLRETGQPEFSENEIALLTSLADRVGAEVESHRLREQAEQTAVMEERQRLARDLHDSVTQSMYSVTLLAETGRLAAGARDLEVTENCLYRLGSITQQALKEMRLLIYELRPPVLEQEGLIGALQQRLDAVESRAGVNARLRVENEIELAASQEEAFYRIALEALNNSLKHAGASVVTVRIRADDELVSLEVDDDGQGFDPQATDDTGGMGLVTMQERAKQAGGVFQVISAPGEGTKVGVTISRKQEAGSRS